MKDRSPWILGFVAMLAILLVWARASHEPERVQYEPETVDSVLPEKAEAISRAPLPEVDGPGNDIPPEKATIGVLLEDPSGEIVRSEGKVLICVSRSGTGALNESALVKQGHFPVSPAMSRALLDGSFSQWSLYFSGESIGVSGAVAFFHRVVGGEQQICFSLPAPRTVLITAVDLQGSALASVSIDSDARSGWALWGTNATKTDSFGKAQLTVYSGVSEITLRAALPGYITESVTLRDAEVDVRITMHRLFAICVVSSDRSTMAMRSSVQMGGGYTFAIRDADTESLVRTIEARNPIADDEAYQWDIFGERRWASDPKVNIDFGGWFGGYLGSVAVDLQHLSDPEFSVFRTPSHILEKAPPQYEVQFRFGRAEQFKAQPPDRIQLRVLAKDPSQSLAVPFSQEGEPTFVVSPRRISGTLYRAFLPDGEFVLSDIGPDWSPRMPHKDPRLLGDLDFTVTPSTAPLLVDVLLHPDEAFVRQRFTDSFGRPVDLEAVLLPESVSLNSPMLGFFATSGRSYLERFVRPGNYSIWIHHPELMGSIRLPTPVAWSGDLASDGYWDIPLNLASLESTLIMR